MSAYVKNETKQLPDPTKMCYAKTHFVFVKVHKCGSTTVEAVLRQFALNNRLIATVPVTRLLGWPHPVRREYIYRIDDLEKRGMHLDAVFHHHQFNRQTWKRLMPADTVYLAVMREPLDQLRSALGYMDFLKRRVKGPDHKKVHV